MIEITPLRYFVSAFELGTISAAALAHGISQPSLSQAVSKLEEAVAGALFVRTRKGLRPTARGRQLYQHAQTILGAVRNAEDSFRSSEVRHVGLFTSPDILLRPFRGGFLALQHHLPGLELRFERTAEEAELALTDRACSPRSHSFHELVREPYVLAVHKAHPLAGRRTLKLDDLRTVALIARRYCPHHDALLKELAADQLVPVISAEAVHDQQVLELARLGFGAALLPRGHVADDESLAAIPVEHPSLGERSMGVAVRKTASANEMFRIWMTGFTTPSPSI